MRKSLPGLTVYNSLKQLLLALEGYVVKQKIMLPVVFKIFKISFNILNFKIDFIKNQLLNSINERFVAIISYANIEVLKMIVFCKKI